MIILATVWNVLFSAHAMALAGAWLLGNLSVIDDTGRRSYGSYISVFLTR